MDYVYHVRAANRQAGPLFTRWFIILHKQHCNKGHGNNIFPELFINISPKSLRILTIRTRGVLTVEINTEHWHHFLLAHTGGASAKSGMEKGSWRIIPCLFEGKSSEIKVKDTELCWHLNRNCWIWPPKACKVKRAPKAMCMSKADGGQAKHRWDSRWEEISLSSTFV